MISDMTVVHSLFIIMHLLLTKFILCLSMYTLHVLHRNELVTSELEWIQQLVTTYNSICYTFASKRTINPTSSKACH